MEITQTLTSVKCCVTRQRPALQTPADSDECGDSRRRHLIQGSRSPPFFPPQSLRATARLLIKTTLCLCKTYTFFRGAAVLGCHVLLLLLAEQCLNASFVADCSSSSSSISRGTFALCSSPSRTPASARTHPFVCGSVPDGASISDFISGVLLPSQLQRALTDHTHAKGDFNQKELLETRRPSPLSGGLLIIWSTL